MKITFNGAAGEVTGSCHHIEINGHKLLVDCGQFQGSHYIEDRNYNPFGFNAAELDAVMITHAHLDHTGRVPQLIHQGFEGPIYANHATKDLTKLIWEDALGVMLYNQKKYEDPPLFHQDDIDSAWRHFKGVDYGRQIAVAEGVQASFFDAGHILGSAFIRLEAEGKTVVFSGDIGNSHVPIVRETHPLGEVDALVLETTYGAVSHEDPEKRIYLLQGAIVDTMKRGGVLMIPAFSLERTQEILYEMNQLVESKLMPRVPIFLDSPLAAAATEIFEKYPQYYDEAAHYLVGKGDNFFKFPGLVVTNTSDESKRINDMRGPKIIIAGSGMINGGRIQHHVLRYVSDPKSMVLIISYQAEGTIGRRLLQGAKEVKIYGQTVPVHAEVRAIGAYSAHGDQNKLVRWVADAKRPPKKIFLVHGEPASRDSMEEKLKVALPGVEVFKPMVGESAEV